VPRPRGNILEQLSVEVDMRPIARALVMSVVLILLTFMAFSYWSGTAWDRYPRMPGPRAVGTSGVLDRAREKLDDTALSSKIKAKMVLDDTVKARTIDVTTRDSVVTLSGTVETVAEHDRALQLARETLGVTEVIDRLGVRSSGGR
jgi:hyperosmotically inducible protein